MLVVGFFGRLDLVELNIDVRGVLLDATHLDLFLTDLIQARHSNLPADVLDERQARLDTQLRDDGEVRGLLFRESFHESRLETDTSESSEIMTRLRSAWPYRR